MSPKRKLLDDGALEPRLFGPDGALRAGKNPGFYALVYAVVRLVPAGRVTTYGDVGTIIGSPRIARQVGWALSNLDDDTVPWQRVINAHGSVSARGDVVRAALQQALLRSEGVVIDPQGRIDLAALRYDYPGVAVPFRALDGSGSN